VNESGRKKETETERERERERETESDRERKKVFTADFAKRESARHNVFGYTNFWEKQQKIKKKF
jgi:hypothetical protein